MAKATKVRRGTLNDLDALIALEKAGFQTDQFSPSQLRYLLGKASATTLLLEQEGEVMGAAIMLWRKKSSVARLYSIVIAPEFQSGGLGTKLLRACEETAVAQGFAEVGLEVRADNRRAISFYKRHGYRAAESLPGFYADGTAALRMVRALEGKAGLRLEIPYYAQTLEFTCGPACLMMAMKYFNPALALNRSLELVLWKEATLIFMTSGLGGCGPFGLAVAARRRGYRASLILSNRRTPFLSSVRRPEKKEVIRLVHEHLKEEARSLGVGIDYFDFTFEDIARAMRGGQVPIVLISTYRLHRVRAPHWVVVTGFDRQNVYFHDPYEGFYVPDKHQAQHMGIPITEFRRMRRYGKDVKRSAIFVSQPQQAPVA